MWSARMIIAVYLDCCVYWSFNFVKLEILIDQGNIWCALFVPGVLCVWFFIAIIGLMLCMAPIIFIIRLAGGDWE